MTKMKINLICLFVALMATLTFTTVQAQFEDPDPPPREIPFDGGLSLIIAAGVAYAAKKGYDKKNKQKQTTDIER